MTDSYSEDIVVGKRSFLLKLAMIAAVIIAGLSIALCLFIRIIGYVVAILGIGIIILIFSKKNLEYEYIITNGDMDVAAIYNKSTRKKKLSFGLSEINMIVPTGSPRVDGLITQKKIKKIYDFSSATTKDNSYDLVIERGGNKEIVRVTLSDKSLDIYKSGAKNIFYAD